MNNIAAISFMVAVIFTAFCYGTDNMHIIYTVINTLMKMVGA